MLLTHQSKINDWCLEKILFFAGGNQTHLVDYQLKLRIDYWHMNKSQPKSLKTVFLVVGIFYFLLQTRQCKYMTMNQDPSYYFYMDAIYRGLLRK